MSRSGCFSCASRDSSQILISYTSFVQFKNLNTKFAYYYSTGSIYRVHIILDTNIIYGSYFFETTKFQALFKYLKDTKHTLFIPEIVILEVKKHYGLEVGKFAAEVSKFNKTLSTKKIDFDFQSCIEEFEKEIETLIKKHNIVIVSTASLEIDQNNFQKKFINRVKPIKESGAGYQDLIIWECVKAVLIKRVPFDYLAFISNNKNDFGIDSLHENLLQELETNKDRLLYFTALENFLTEYEKPIEFINEVFLLKIYENNKDLFKNILSQMPLDVQPEYSFETIRDTFFYDFEILDVRIYNYYLYKADSKKFYISVELNVRLAMYVESEEYDGPAYSDADVHFQISVDKSSKEAEIIDEHIDVSQ